MTRLISDLCTDIPQSSKCIELKVLKITNEVNTTKNVLKSAKIVKK